MFASNFFENVMINLMRNQNYTAPSTYYLGLFITSPTDTGTAGQEISYSGYQRQVIEFSSPTASGSSLTVQNVDMISFPESPSNAGQVNFVGVFDSSENMYLYGQCYEFYLHKQILIPIRNGRYVRAVWHHDRR